MLPKSFIETISKTEEDTSFIAKKLSKCLQKQDVILFYGDVGAGKTVFARALIRALYQNEAMEVVSPTFTLVNVYDQKTPHIWHFDLYSIKHEDEIYELGWDVALTSDIMLVEWAEKLIQNIPENALSIHFKTDGRNRILSFYGNEECQKRISDL